jgi:phosphomannomutase
MVSASHNPSQYNGVKMVAKGGLPVSGETGIYEIGKMIDSLPELKSKKKGKVEKLEIMKDYVAHSLKRIDVKKLRHFNIVIDTANAMGGPVSAEFFKHLDCELTHLYPELDGRFPNHEANPLKEETLKVLKETVKKKKADLGIAFDGDSDRCGFVDEKGETIGCDLISALVAKALLEDKKGARMLFDVRSSKVIGEIIKDNGGTPGRCMVGHSLVKTQMKKENAYFAGELSGHYYFQSENYAEAPFLTVLNILKLMTEEKKKLSELVTPLKKYFQSGEINSTVEDKEGKMKEIAAKFKEGKVSWMDGVTVEFEDYWFNVRPSNTEPLLRLNLEANTKKMMEEKRDLVLKIIKSK